MRKLRLVILIADFASVFIGICRVYVSPSAIVAVAAALIDFIGNSLIVNGSFDTLFPNSSMSGIFAESPMLRIL